MDFNLLSDEQQQDNYRKSLAKKSCASCSFTYQSTDDTKSLVAAAKKVDRDTYNMLFLDIFCENRFKPGSSGNACGYEQSVNWFNIDGFEPPSQCPKCSSKVLGTGLLMKVSIGGIVESFCINCLKKFSQSQPFRRV